MIESANANIQPNCPTVDLPNLAVITDVPVEQTVGGPLVLFRLLREYPVDRLRVVQSTIYKSKGDDVKLKGVDYRYVDYRPSRLLRNKFFGVSLQAGWMWTKRRMVQNALIEFPVEAVLTVTHDFLWLVAAGIARSRKVPLHLVLHDDWTKSTLKSGIRSIDQLSESQSQRTLARVYRQAASRLNVSPGMMEKYTNITGCDGQLLYPNRGEDSPEAKVRATKRRSGHCPTLGFAGSIHTRGVRELLIDCANALRSIGGRLAIWGPTSADALKTLGLDFSNVLHMGFPTLRQMADQMELQVDALLLPGSFIDDERDLVSTLFPSKLADYTAVGLPIIIWAPSYSSAARWGKQNESAAATLTNRSVDALLDCFTSIRSNVDFAVKLASESVRVGNKYFGLDSARDTFYACLKQSS